MFIQSQLADGNVVILQSWASGKSLRSFHGTAQGVGGFGVHGTICIQQSAYSYTIFFPLCPSLPPSLPSPPPPPLSLSLSLCLSVCLSAAQWKVHVRRPGVIALQNIHTSEHWLAIRDGKTIGNVFFWCVCVCVQ